MQCTGELRIVSDAGLQRVGQSHISPQETVMKKFLTGALGGTGVQRPRQPIAIGPETLNCLRTTERMARAQGVT